MMSRAHVVVGRGYVGDMVAIDTLEALTALYSAPSERVMRKKRDRLDDGLRVVLASSPFVLLATADAQGRCDVSPRGGPPGFVKPLDDCRVALPDLNGNNLIDSLRNLIENPRAALLVVLPGQGDTLRIDGRAMLTTDADVLDRFTEELRRPTLAIVIEIEAVFGHCAKSIRRGRLWEPETWVSPDRRPVLEARYAQLRPDQTLDEYVVAHDCGLTADLALDSPPD
jgi:uncharacterized protein